MRQAEAELEKVARDYARARELFSRELIAVQALLLSFFTIFPVMVISGGFVPVESMPRAIRYLAVLSPLRHYMEIGLGIFLKGVGMDVLWWPAALMTTLGLVVFGFGVFRFRRQLA